jgi:predicted ester cyclase
MLAEELKAVARRFPEELLTQGDLAVAGEFLAPDCAHHATTPLAPGVEGVKQWVRALRLAFPDLCAIVEEETALGDLVIQCLMLSGRHDGPFIGIPATGKRATWQLVTLQRLGRDGRFAEQWISMDLRDLLRQLGTLSDASAGCDAEGDR